MANREDAMKRATTTPGYIRDACNEYDRRGDNAYNDSDVAFEAFACILRKELDTSISRFLKRIAGQ